ncbi:type VI secretion system baseplate subunit TssG [Burkholderia glumae]|uniref:type VI secretion system baseplate subunit TssG n=2 Tax=Burkholderia glumae TaxID=337 RepID=UPI0021509D44|nr:type VI secretion system baseplate subunit TssG [Burkholderia glumae]UVS98371.1 type VI secretion system baseplate subunit TssG [Burkholderia glumae]
MASIGRHRYRTVRESMLRQYEDFNVFQLMRLMLSDTDKRLPIGRRLRFRADLSAAFPASEFTRVAAPPPVPSVPPPASGARLDPPPGTAAAGGPPLPAAEAVPAAPRAFEITTANLCVASVSGPMPEPFTEWARELAALRATAMADFFDIFNQRANVLRYELKQRLTPGLDDTPPDRTEAAGCLAALVGLGSPQLSSRVPLPQRAWLGIAGLLANRRRQGATLVEVLRVALGARVELTENVGAWHDLDERDRCALGRRNHRLGQTSVVGRRVWDQQARVRLEIGVLDYAALCRLLPPAPNPAPAAVPGLAAPAAPGYAMLSGLVKLLVDRLADVEIVLQVDDASIPDAGTPLPQPARGTDGSSMRLGQSAWLAGAPAHRHATRPVRFLITTRDSGSLA